ncbi:MAG: hypothetical protein FWH21_08570 [Kiritimatiellaeota bacterium]|nr:hypothetical protein [Kiritimatiellota bacterium]
MMKKTVLCVMPIVLFCAGMIVLVRHNVFFREEHSGIFPLPSTLIGLSSEELLRNYPTGEILFEKRNNGQILEGGIVTYDLLTNEFWDTLWVGIDNSEVRSFSYLKDEKDDAVRNIKPLFKRLKQLLGTAFEKKVTYGETKSRCAMYVWKREKDVVVFSHSPVARYKKGDFSFCQLTVASKIEDIGALYKNMATDSVPEDEMLWADAMDE